MIRLALSIALAACLAACGGGGASSSPPPSAIPLTVKVNNVVVAPVGNALTIASGDTVSVEASKPVQWIPVMAGAVVTNNVVTIQTWTGRIVKVGAAALNVQLTAAAGSESTLLTFTIPQGDTRNGEYKLFSANANEYRLRIDFDARQYTISSGTTTVSSGSFSTPANGTYTFEVPGYAPASNNARFRISEGVIVGAHPVGGSEALPFVAANNFVTSPADMPLTNLWQFSSDVTPSTAPAVNSRIQSLRISGEQITYCSVAGPGPITTVGNCLAANLETHTLIYNADRSVTWLDNGVPVNLHLVRSLTGEVFLIRAQSYPGSTGNKRFQIALDDQFNAFSGDYEGGISNGSWGTSSTMVGSFSRVAVTSAGAADNISGALGSAGALAQPLRAFTAGDGVLYFVQGTGLLGAHIAARGSAKAGQVGVGLKR